MQNKVTYEYAIIRIVPKVEREEFLNIGVILFSKRLKYLKMKYLIDEHKLKAFSKEIDTDQIKNYLKAWEAVCKGGSKAGSLGQEALPYRFRWLTAPKSTIIQSSRPHPGLCTDPDKILEKLFEQYVV